MCSQTVENPISVEQRHPNVTEQQSIHRYSRNSRNIMRPSHMIDAVQSFALPKEWYSGAANEQKASIDNESTSTQNLLRLIHQSQQQQHELVDAIQLPKTDLMTFDGDPLKYYVFMRTFENIVDKKIH